MSSVRVDNKLNNQTYFVTFSVYRRYYIFDRYQRWNILSDTIKFYQATRYLKLYSFVFMLNHAHLTIQSPGVAGFIRDFKKHTCRKVKENLTAYEPNLLKLFVKSENEFHLWQKTNMPILLESEYFFEQKREYIEINPVRKGYVSDASFWYWSSANIDCELKAVDFLI